MAILIYHHHQSGRSSKGWAMLMCHAGLSVVTSRVSEVTDIFLSGVWPTMKSTHTEISENTAEEGQAVWNLVNS